MKIFKIEKIGFFENLKSNINSIKESINETFNKKLLFFIFVFSMTPLILANYVSIESLNNFTDKNIYGVGYSNLIFSFILNLFFMFLTLCFFTIPFYKNGKIKTFLTFFKRKRFYFTLVLSFMIFFVLLLLTISTLTEIVSALAPELNSKIYTLMQYYQGTIENIPETKKILPYEYKIIYGGFFSGFLILLFIFYILYSFVMLNIKKDTSTIFNIKCVLKNLYKNFLNILLDIIFIIFTIFLLIILTNYFYILNQWYFEGFINTFLLIFSSFYMHKVALKYFKKETYEDFE